MISFLVGLLIGGACGVFIMCMCNVASKADEDMERISKQLNDKNSDKE